MNAKDMIAVVEYLKAFDKPKKTKRSFSPDLDIESFLRKRKEETDKLEKFIKEMTKKEEKKEDKKHAFTFAEGVILAIVAQMFIGPMYKMFLLHLGIQ